MKTHVKIIGVIYILVFLFSAIFYTWFFLTTPAFEIAEDAPKVIIHYQVGWGPSFLSFTRDSPSMGLGLILHFLFGIIPGILGGIGLLKFKRWGRFLIILLSFGFMFNFFLGTIFGIYTLWVLLKKETGLLFSQEEVSPNEPSYY